MFLFIKKIIMQKINLIGLLGLLSISISAHFEDLIQPTAPIIAAEPKPVKIEDLVGKVLNTSMNKPNLEGNTKKIVSDLSAILVAGLGYLLSNKLLPKLPLAAMTENGMPNMAASFLTAYLSFRLSNSGLTKFFQKINWDPRDLAVAEILINTIKNGTPVTSDYAQLQDIFNQMIPEGAQTKGILTMSREQKVKFSRCIRGFLEALKIHQKISAEA